MTFSLGGPRPLKIALLAAGMLAGNAVYAPAQTPAAASIAAPETPALPSGLAPVSQLLVGGSPLALDSNGAVFRLEGKHWHPVHQQWAGKAVELLGIPALNAAPGSGQAPRMEGQQEAFSAVLLRSTTDLHWVSVDRGKTWKPSTLDDVRRNDVKWSGDHVASVPENLNPGVR